MPHQGGQHMDIGRLRLLTVSLAGVWLSVATASAGLDVPVPGKVLKLRAGTAPGDRVLVFRSQVAAALQGPFSDPTAGATLHLFASNGSGQCRGALDLPAQNWQPIGKDGTNKGWRYLDKSAANGIKRLVLRRRGDGGRLTLKGVGAALPCDLSAAAQALPIAVELEIGATRYCASFGGAVKKNAAGIFRARDAAAPTACLDRDVSAANLNILHGIFCPSATSYCRGAERIALLGQWMVARGCPDVVALQEVFDGVAGGSNAALIASQLTSVCPFPYTPVYVRTNGVDDSFILSRYPTLDSEVAPLHGPLRNLLYARLAHPVGPIDVVSTHLASGSDAGSSPCAVFGSCPQACLDAGAVTVRDCQAVQVAEYLEGRHDVDTPALLMGDFNAEPGTFVYDQYTDRGWIDTTLAAGNSECDPFTGLGCTSGRIDDELTDMESTELNVDRRIDFIFVIPPSGAASCAGVLDTPADSDGDGVATRLFADLPNPFGVPCGTAPAPICWPSDHTGVQADLNCAN